MLEQRRQKALRFSLLFVLFVGMQTLQTTTAQEVEVQTASGEKQLGKLVRIENDAAVVNIKGDERSFSFREIENITSRSVREAAVDSTITVGLIDASRLNLAAVQVAEDGLTARLGNDEIQLPRRAIATIEFPTPADLAADDQAALQQQWQETLTGELTSDVLLLRKQDESQDPSWTLTAYEGVILAIDEEAVQFRFDDTVVPVQLQRIHGLRFYQVDQSVSSEPLCEIRTANGSSLMAKALEVSGDVISVQTNFDASLQLSNSAWQVADFTFGRVVYLDALTPSTEIWRPFVSSPSASEMLSQLNRPQRNRSFRDEPLTLFDAGNDNDLGIGLEPTIKTFENGLAIKSYTRLVYNIGGEYERFVAKAGLDPKVRPHGNVELIVSTDNDEKLRRVITGKDIRPLDIDVSLQGVRRLVIEVDFGDDADVADLVHLVRARLIK